MKTKKRSATLPRPLFEPLHILLFVATLLAFGISGQARAERVSEFDGYTVHYNVLNTDILDPEVARSYRITRSRERAMMIVAVLKNADAGQPEPIKASIAVNASNLNAQLREVTLRPVFDQEAIYYIGEFPITHMETLNFQVRVAPEDSGARHQFSFSEQFFAR